jgi:hypothetical protein
MGHSASFQGEDWCGILTEAVKTASSSGKCERLEQDYDGMASWREERWQRRTD